MAKIIGTSDAWKSVCLMLDSENLKPETPLDIHRFLEAAKNEYALAKAKETQDVRNKIDALKKDIELQENNYDTEVQRGLGEILASIESTQLALQILQIGFIKKLLNFFIIREQKEKIQKLKSNYDDYPRLIQRKINLLKGTLEKIQNNTEIIIEKQCRPMADKVRLLESVLRSSELAGAIAELELIESLRTLPDSFFVINDVEIEINRAIHFDGEWLRSAQIDHVVVAPSGIFVIEVKNWSAKFVQEGGYFDPYQQVKRSTYLCYKLIGEKFSLKTRSIVAYKGSIPKKPANSYAKVLPINEVKEYVLWFKDSAVSEQVVERVAREFVDW